MSFSSFFSPFLLFRLNCVSALVLFFTTPAFSGNRTDLGIIPPTPPSPPARFGLSLSLSCCGQVQCCPLSFFFVVASFRVDSTVAAMCRRSISQPCWLRFGGVVPRFCLPAP